MYVCDFASEDFCTILARQKPYSVTCRDGLRAV